MKFEWDPVKAAFNLRKHGVSFEEAETVFTSGIGYLESFDSLHGGDEDRWLAIGMSSQRLLWVVFAESSEDTLRILGARRANRAERVTFEQWHHGKKP